MVHRRLYKSLQSRAKKCGNKQTSLTRRHMEQQAIPAFYCCYLLRSTVSHRSLYVGSTPNPRRRLSQHNGEYKGGARRTSRELLRPWEMTCIVTGFPSSIAALQFEWAWQNPHLSLKIPSAQRVATSTYRTRSGRTKHARPNPSLTGKLEHLHLLLRVDAFSRWPLSVRFFVRDAYEAWKLWCERESTTLRESIKIAFDQRLRESGDETEKVSPPPPPPRKTKWSAHGEGGVQGLDITYDYLDRHLQKSRDILRPGVGLECGLCHDSLENHTFTLVCPHAFCEYVAHMTCLAREFLRQESSPGDECQIPVLPTHGKCPGCKNKTEWVELVKELSIRTRSKPKKIAAKRKATKKDAEYDDSEDDDDDDEDITAADLAEIPQGREGEQVVWGDHDTDMDSAFSDTGSERGDKSRKRKGNPKVGKRLPVVIEDVSSDPGSETGSVRSGSKTAKRKGKAPAKKELPVVIEDSEIGSDLSISGSETRRAKSRSKSRKEKGLAQAKEKMIQVVIEDSDVESNLSNSGTETETVTGGGKLKKRRLGTGLRGRKTLPVVIEDSDIDSDLDKS